MSSIDKLSKVTTLSASDLLAMWSGSVGNDVAVTLANVLAWLQPQLTASGLFITQYSAPAATGFSVAVTPPSNGNNVFLLLTPAAGYAAGTITLPVQTSCIDQQEVLCACTQAVTTLTVAGNGATVNGAPTTLIANGSFRLRFDGVFKAWYLVSSNAGSVASAGNPSAAAYDGSNRVTSFTIGAVTFTVTGWGTSSIVVAGSDGTTRTITLDGSGRFLAAT